MSNRKLNIRIGFDMKAFSTSSQNLSRSLQKTANKMKSIGSSMSMYVTAPLAGMAALSLKAFDEQAKALAQVEAGLKSTGGAVGFTTKELEKMAEAMQVNSLFGDEEILKNATAQLLTFTNIAGEQFEKTQQAALDLATRLDGDLKSSSIMLGKALNDPVANLSALSRAGIQFSTEQKATVKALVETNRLADAQTLILGELEKQYGGSAEAAARAGLGPMKQLQMAIGDLSEEFGKIIAEYLIPFTDKLRGVVSMLKNTSPEVKKTILIVAALAAAIGPLIFAVGALTAALAFLAANPIVLIITGIILAIAGLVAAIIYVKNNFQAFADFFYNLWVKVANNFISVIQKIAKGYFYIVDLFGLDIGNTLSDFLEGLKLTARDSTKKFDTLGETIDKVKSKFTKAISPTKELTKEVKSLGESAEEVTAKATIMTDTIKDFSKLKMPKLDVKFAGGSGRSSISEASKSLLNELDLLAQEAKMKATKIGEDISEALTQGLQRLAVDSAVIMGEFLGGLATGDANVEDFGKNILNAIGSFMGQFGQAMIAIGIAQAGINAAIASMNPVLAIAGGIALVAAGAALSNVASRGIEGASGGSSYSSPTYSGNPSFDTAQYESMTSISGRDIRIIQRRESGFTR